MNDRRTKSLPAAQIENVRTIARDIVANEFAGNIKAAADQMGIAYSTLYNLIEGGGGAGNVTLQRLSEHTKMSMDELLGRASDDPDSMMPIYKNILGWDESAEIVKNEGRAPEWAVDAAAMMAAVVAPERATPEFVLDAAQFAARHAVSREKVVEAIKRLEAARRGVETRALRKMKLKP